MFLHLLAAVTLIFITIPIWLKPLAITLILVFGVRTIAQYVLLKNNYAVVKISASGSEAEGQCRIEINNGKVFHAHIKNAGWLFEYFAILVLKTSTKTFKTIIAKDAINQEQFYALRLYLRSLNTQR